MRFQKFRTKPKIRYGTAHRSLQTVGAGYDTDHRDLYEERTLALPCSRRTAANRRRHPDIAVGDPREFPLRCEKAKFSPSDRYRHYWSCVPKTTRTPFTRGPRYHISDGIMRAGTHVTGPSQVTERAEFTRRATFILLPRVERLPPPAPRCAEAVGRLNAANARSERTLSFVTHWRNCWAGRSRRKRREQQHQGTRYYP